MTDYTKLSSLVDSEFTVESVGLAVWKLWDKANNKMLSSDEWQKGYQKKYPVTTDKGLLDLGPGQLGNLLEAVLHAGKADLNGVTFHVKSNMTKEEFANASKEDKMKVRYYFNPVKKESFDQTPEEQGEMPW